MKLSDQNKNNRLYSLPFNILELIFSHVDEDLFSIHCCRILCRDKLALKEKITHLLTRYQPFCNTCFLDFQFLNKCIRFFKLDKKFMYEPIGVRILNRIETLNQPEHRLHNSYLHFQFWTACKDDSEEHKQFIEKYDFKASEECCDRGRQQHWCKTQKNKQIINKQNSVKYNTKHIENLQNNKKHTSK